MSRSAAARQAAREKQSVKQTATDLLAQLAALDGGHGTRDGVDTGIDERELLRQIESLDDDNELLVFVNALDVTETAEGSVLRQLEAALLVSDSRPAKASPLPDDEPSFAEVTQADESNPDLLSQLAALMEGGSVSAEDAVGDAPQALVKAEPVPVPEPSMREQLLEAKRHAVALKREGRIAEAKAALAEVKRLTALLESQE
jgi:hypothetical protein